MKPKLTWRVRRWSTGAWVEPVSAAFRQRYGDSAADVVEVVLDLLRDHRDQPSMQDMKATLRALAEAPAGADLARLDTRTDALMVKHAWLTFHTTSIAALQPEQVAACALAALADMPAINGRPKTDGFSLMLVDNLLAQLPPHTPPSTRDGLLRAALRECGLGTSVRTIKAMHSLAGKKRIQVERNNIMLPANPWHAMVHALETPRLRPRKTRGRRAG